MYKNVHASEVWCCSVNDQSELTCVTTSGGTMLLIPGDSPGAFFHPPSPLLPKVTSVLTSK